MVKSSGNVIVIGRKESFLIRALVGKLGNEGYTAKYVPANIDDIEDNWGKDGILIYYLEAEEILPDKLSTFLRDKLNDTDRQIIVIGDKGDNEIFTKAIGERHINKAFTRPLNNDDFVDYLNEEGEKISGSNRKSILIVDDDPTYMGLIREWLRDRYKVSMANSGVQAIAWLTNNKADLILLDFEMPVTTGPQVLEMLRSEEKTRSIPVIFLTGKSDKASVVQVVSLKPEGYLLKTIQKMELIDKIDTFFASRKM